jgi:hypothetical protein
MGNNMDISLHTLLYHISAVIMYGSFHFKEKIIYNWIHNIGVGLKKDVISYMILE